MPRRVGRVRDLSTFGMPFGSIGVPTAGYEMLLTALRISLLVLLLAVRLFLGIGPVGLVLCVHGDGDINIESSAELCCSKPTCSGTRTPARGTPLPHLADEDDGDDECKDFAFTTNDSRTSADSRVMAGNVHDLAAGWDACLASQESPSLEDVESNLIPQVWEVPRSNDSSHLSRRLRC